MDGRGNNWPIIIRELSTPLQIIVRKSGTEANQMVIQKFSFNINDIGSSCGLYWPTTKGIKGCESRSIATHKRFSVVQMGNADVATE
jgi:hypothetical protein